MSNLEDSDLVLAGCIIAMITLMLWQLWYTYSEDKMILGIKDGALYVDNVKFCLTEAGNGRSNFKSGRWSLEVKRSTKHQCSMLHAEGFGWIGARPDADAVLGHVRGRGTLLSDVLAEERLRIDVIDALNAGKEVILEVQ